MKPFYLKLVCLSLVTMGFALTEANAGDSAEDIVGGRCAVCHGLEGESTSSQFPKLAGQHAAYLEKQLLDFQSGKRKSDTMGAQVKGIPVGDLKAISLYFSQKKSEPYLTKDVDLQGVGRYIYTKGNPYSGVPPCASCHSTEGFGTERLPRLASQSARYVAAQLKQFDQRVRTNDNEVMFGIAGKLTELETLGVAEYISTLPQINGVRLH